MTAHPAADAAPRDELVTGEGVLLDLRAASFASRILAFAIDAAIQIVLLVLGTWALVVLVDAAGLDGGYAVAGELLMSVIVLVGVPVLWETLTRGRSPGRLALGTRVVRDDGGAVHLRQSLLRALTAVGEIWSTSGMVALACSVIDPRSRRVGDLLAGTFVVQERLRAPAPVREPMPAELAAWARGADVGRLPGPLLQDVRAFLARRHGLGDISRRGRARDLLQRTVPHVAPPPPVGTDPEVFLVALLAERSRRDEESLRVSLEREGELVAQVARVPFSR